MDFDEHFKMLDENFQQLKYIRMQFNLNKSEVCTIELDFLGFLLTQKKLPAQWEKDQSDSQNATSHNLNKVKGFVETINFIKNHILIGTEIMSPIIEVMKKDVPSSLEGATNDCI